MPAALEYPFRSSSSSSTRSTTTSHHQQWWDHIHPGNEQERRWSRSSAVGADAAAGMPAGWSLFDAKKLSLGLGIASHTAVFLRLMMSSDLQQRRSSVDMQQLVKISLVADVFCKCSALSLQLSATESAATAGVGVGVGVGGGPDDDAAGIAWLRSPLPVTIRSSTPFTAAAALLDVETVLQRHKGSSSSYVISSSAQLSPAGGKLVVSEKLLLVAENLMCVMYNSLAATTRSSYQHQQQGGYVDHHSSLQPHEVESIRRALDAAASQHPPRAFIAQAARWTKDLLV